jgi:hypothetical protein
MKVGALAWSGNNIGDDIQTVAVMQHLPRVDVFIHRDRLHAYDGPQLLLVMNGWFLMEPHNWPPSPAIRPIFFGFHVQERAKPSMAKHADYLFRHQPIGCRDRGTVEFIRSLGVEAYLSFCATLTFDAPEDRAPDSLYLVEASRHEMARSIKKRHGLKVKEVSHRFIDVPHETRLGYAREVVRAYGRHAAMVVTSRIHCAMPCLAMGIPTLFVGPRNYRTQILEDVGLVRHDPLTQIQRIPAVQRLLGSGQKEWPKPLDISEIKCKVSADLRSRIAEALAQGSDGAARRNGSGLPGSHLPLG